MPDESEILETVRGIDCSDSFDTYYERVCSGTAIALAERVLTDAIVTVVELLKTRVRKR